MADKWVEYFKKETAKHHGILEYAVRHWDYNKPLYFRIKQLIPPPAKIIEVGCGLGVSDIYLQACGYEVVGIDNDSTIITTARENAQYFNSAVRFEEGEAFKLTPYYKKFDLAFSSGVIEHFDTAETISLLQEQTKCAQYVLAVIPTKYTRYTAPITDERIYTIKELSRIFQDAGLDVINRFGYGDIVSPFHNQVHRILPHAVYRILQDHFSYAMAIGCIGERISEET